MIEPLTGTVTLFFSDIEGSTRLLHERGDEYADLLAEHRRVVRAKFSQNRGREVDTQGDAFFAVFARAGEAVAAAQAIQSALDEGPVRVRIGIHTGAPLWTGEGYVGADVHLAARVCSAAHGGQVLLTESTWGLVTGEESTNLGLHRLKDIDAPMQLYQLGTTAFPPLRTMHAHNLPVQPTGQLIGREAVQMEIAALLAEGGPHLLTLVGPGGIGKTSLALAVAAGRVPLTPAGVFFVDLTKVRDPALVGLTIAQTVGAAGDLARHIGDKAMLLVLDNMEHVIGAGTQVAQLLGSCPNLRLIVTSRIRLRIRGEQLVPIEPLPQDASVALFLRRAQAVDPSVISDDAVVEICRRLDGLPLAIELAASRLHVLSAPDLLRRLERRLPVLSGGQHDLPDRQKTLRATVAWSVDLLPSDSRALFCRLAVFVGGWTLEAAEAICGARLDDLGTLMEHSLVHRTGNRYGMLETIREFASDELADIPEADTLPASHARYYVNLCRSGLAVAWFADGLEMIDDSEFLRFARTESANLEATLTWLRMHGSEGELSTAVKALWLSWLLTGATEVGERWLQAALDVTDETDSTERAWLITILGEYPRFAGDSRRAIKIKHSALVMARNVGDDGIAAAVLADLTSLHLDLGEIDEARRYGQQALALRQKDGSEGDLSRSPGIAHALKALAEVAIRSGDPVAAEALVRRADDLEALANVTPHTRLMTKLYLHETLRGQGRTDEAHVLAREVLARAIELDYPGLIVESLVAMAEVRSHDDLAAAAELIGAVETLQEGVLFTGTTRDAYRRTIERVREALGEAAYEAATRNGRHLSNTDLLALA